ncbi:phenylalanine--tRNA ligase subunit beta [Pelagibacteraceae bacterium]|mgnify:CR=1 FL=1|jgi:phenylalanyl-tRNA synthetase beta chain|nr:phenylalanine--tRNA ligase subunit beta [Pelagibacteraceae bacterium]|tara:strand:+ start:2291 stop:4693 length:2403 start_codon:yes stop_codon:yes gene_type:complete
MIITIPWLKEHLQTKANEAKIIEQLTNIGLEVEGIKENSGELGEFKVAKILKTKKHPNADKLKVCDITLGDNKIIKVVCGAPNARDGLVTIYAPPGAVIPKTNFELKVAKIRGVESKGMLCSESELNLSNESNGIVELKNKEKDIGKSYFKSNSEKSIDISITPNRADCLGVRGIARDLAASGLGSLLKLKKKNLKQKLSQPLKVSISKEKDQGCLSFGTCYIKNIINKESPEWLKNKILALGLKPISAVVDITNYVMFDLNRPLHAYDVSKINKEIVVRNSKDGEEFESLDKKKYKLKKGMCVIADKSSILGLGGIIGGIKTSTELDTKNILLESAYFLPSSIRKTARLLNINTDAKYRFERGIDPNSIQEGLEVAAELIVKICGGEASKLSVVGQKIQKNKIIEFDIEKFINLIGISISSSETDKILSSLGFKCKKSKKNLKVEVPSWRADVSQDVDLIEELIRIKGFDKIKLIEPEKKRVKETLDFKQKLFHLSQRSLASKGYVEAVTWSFTDSNIDKQFSRGEKEIKIYNPISTDLDVLRRSIFSNLSIYLKKNLDRGHEDLSFFEIGPVFFGKNPGEQQVIVGGIKSGQVNRKSWNEKTRNIDVFDIKSDAIITLMELGIDEKNIFVNDLTNSSYHPGRSGSITLKSEKGPHLAYFGELHPAIIKKLDFIDTNIFGFEIYLKNIPQPNKKVRQTKPNYNVSDFQKSERDFAFVIDKSFKIGLLERLIKSVDENIIQKVRIFDIYEGENIPKDKKSVAINVILQALDRTLNEKDLDHFSQKIIETVKEKTGAIIRS